MRFKNDKQRKAVMAKLKYFTKISPDTYKMKGLGSCKRSHELSVWERPNVFGRYNILVSDVECEYKHWDLDKDYATRQEAIKALDKYVKEEDARMERNRLRYKK